MSKLLKDSIIVSKIDSDNLLSISPHLLGPHDEWDEAWVPVEQGKNGQNPEASSDSVKPSMRCDLRPDHRKVIRPFLAEATRSLEDPARDIPWNMSNDLFATIETDMPVDIFSHVAWRIFLQASPTSRTSPKKNQKGGKKRAENRQQVKFIEVLFS